MSPSLRLEKSPKPDTCQSSPTAPRDAAPAIWLTDGAEEGGAGDVVGDVVDLEAAGVGVAQQHVGGVAAVEAAERDKRPIGSDLTQRIGSEDRVVADVVDLVEAVRAVAQDHVGGGSGRP